MIGALLGIGAKIFGGLIGKSVGGSVLDKAGGIVEKIVDQKGSKEAASAAVDKASVDQWAAESAKVSRNWFDSLVDGFNRLMRPVAFAFTVWIVMVWPQYDIIGFQKAMVAYEAVPEWLVGLVLSVWGFLFTSRFLTKDMTKLRSKSTKEFQEILEKQRQIETLVKTNTDPDRRVIPEVSGIYSEPAHSERDISGTKTPSEKRYQAEMAREDKPLSLPSIVEWNRRNNPTFSQGG